MPLSPTLNPELIKALENQEKYREQSSKEASVNRTNALSRLGTLAAAIFRDEKRLALEKPADDAIRIYTFQHDERLTITPAELASTEGTTPDEAVSVPFLVSCPWLSRPEFAATEVTWLVGYDIETQSYNDGGLDPETEDIRENTPSHCVSHQWYFNFQGIRFGLIFLTNLRISQADFVKFLNRAIPNIQDPKVLKNVKVYSHFSVYESGWMYSSPADQKNGSGKGSAFTALINERNDEWYGSTDLRSYKLQPPPKTPTGRKSTAKPTEVTVRLQFGDSKKLQSGSLEQLGKTIGIEKKDLPKGTISQMAQFLRTNPRTFCEYAIIDSIITAEAHLFFFHKYKTCMLPSEEHESAEDEMRMPGYSNAYFKGLFQKRYGDGWKQYLGYNSNGMTLAHRAFVHFYHGGRNDVLSVGPRGEAHYLDLHSAYLTSVVMLQDYDFSKVRVTTGSNAEKRLQELCKQGPFQVVGIECSFRFKDDCKPIFPVRIDEAESLPGVRINFNSDGIIFPKSGKSNLTMPEYWVAYNQQLLEQVIVHRVVEFKQLDTHWFSDEILRLLKLRKDSDESDKLFYKNILNFFYGKTAQGVKSAATSFKAHDFDMRVNVSSMTCYPLASYITGFCRATVGELLQRNCCYGITTDGFITPVSRDKLVIIDGDLCDLVQKKLEAGGFDKKFIGCDASGTRSLFIKTRGYLLVAPDKDDPSGSEKLQKLAAMGVRIDKKGSPDPVKDFLTALQRGYADKKYFVKLNEVRKQQQKFKDDASIVPGERTLKNVKVDSSFDMKHLPVKPDTAFFEWNGVEYPFVSFETEPLDTATDFHILRALRKRDHMRDIPAAIFNKDFAYEEIPAEAFEIDDETEISISSTVLPSTSLRNEASDKTSRRKKEQTIEFNRTEFIKAYIELGKRSGTVPKYLELPDYQSLLAKYAYYSNGANSLEELSSEESIDYEDLTDVHDDWADEIGDDL